MSGMYFAALTTLVITSTHAARHTVTPREAG